MEVVEEVRAWPHIAGDTSHEGIVVPFHSLDRADKIPS